MTLFTGKGRPITSYDILADETTGIAIDATMAGGQVSIKDEITPTHDCRNVPLDSSILVNGGTSPKMVLLNDGTLRWAPHNYAYASGKLTDWGYQGTAGVVNNEVVTITATTANSFHDTYVSTGSIAAGFPFTATVKVRKETHNYIYLNVESSSLNNWATIVADLNTVAITQTANGTTSGTIISSSITGPDSNDFYTVSLTATMAIGTAYFTVGLAPAANGNTFETAGEIWWDAVGGESMSFKEPHLSRGYIPSTYLKTTTSASRFGIPQEYHTTEREGTNLLINSQKFELWDLTRSSITANVITAPDGTLTGDLFTADGTTGAHEVTQDLQFGYAFANNEPYTLSVHAKAGTGHFLQFIIGGGQEDCIANFDLANGVVNAYAAIDADPTGTITPVGNGWYRCTMSWFSDGQGSTTTEFAQVDSFSATRRQSNSLDTTVYLWGAQLENDTAATTYTPTGETTVRRTLGNFGIRTEKQVTNLFKQSQDFGATAAGEWDVNRALVANNTAMAPDGSNTADTFADDGNNYDNSHELYQTLSVASGTQMTYSVYMKAVSAKAFPYINVSGSTNYWADVFFDMNKGTIIQVANGSTGTVINNTFIQPVGNGWYRCGMTVTITGSTTNYFEIMLANSIQAVNTSIYYTGWGGQTSTVDGPVYVWGAQAEAGDVATSYVPTASATVTRAADSITANSALFGIQDYSLTKLLLHGDGPTACTTIADSSYLHHTANLTGSAITTNTAQSKFGGSAIYFGADQNQIDYAGNNDFVIGTGDFVVEGWFRRTDNTQSRSLWAFYGAGGANGFSAYHTTSGYVLNWQEPLGNDSNIMHIPMPLNQWIHIALIRSGGKLKLYGNGVALGTAGWPYNDFTDTTNYDIATPYPTLSSTSVNDGFLGQIDEFRVTVGSDKGWANGFTPPTRPYQDTTAFSLFFEGYAPSGAGDFGLYKSTGAIAYFYIYGTPTHLWGYTNAPGWSGDYDMGEITYGVPYKAAGRWAQNDVWMSLNGSLKLGDNSTGIVPAVTKLGIAKTAWDSHNTFVKRCVVVPRGWTDLELQNITGRNTWENVGALKLLEGETEGLAVDATTEGGTVTVLGNTTVRKVNVTLDNSNLTQYGTSPKMVLWNDGKLRWTPHNLETNPHRYPYGWDYQNLDMVSSTEIAPDGVADAQKFIAIAGEHWNGIYGWYATTVGGYPHTASIYAKSGTHRYVDLVYTSYNVSTAWVRATVDLFTGTITATDAGATGTVVDSSITNVGNGWYRISITGIIAETNGSMCFSMAEDAVPESANYGRASWTAAGTETALFWGMQINRGSLLSPLLGDGTIIGIPQTYDPVSNCFAILTEPEWTNSCLYSQAIDATLSSGFWNEANITLTGNSAIAPDGSNTASKILCDDDNEYPLTHYTWTDSITTTASDTYSGSVFLKKDTAQYAQLTISSASSGTQWRAVVADLENGTITQTSNGAGGSWIDKSITLIGDGWYRLTITGEHTDATSIMIIAVVANGTPTQGSFGDASFAAEGTESIFAWGAQLEATYGYPTSYIPTLGATVTRGTDSIKAPLSTFNYGNTSTTMIIDFTPWGVETSQGIISFSNNDSYTDVFGLDISESNTTLNDITIFNRFARIQNGVRSQVAARFANNNVAGSSDGATTVSDTNGTRPSTANLNWFQLGGIGTYKPYQRLTYHFTVLPRGLINSELQIKSRET